MPNITKTVAASVSFSPEEIAELFNSMDSDEQAQFFNAVYAEAKKWPSCTFYLQVMYIRDSKLLNDDGLQAMRIIGNNYENEE